MYIGKVAELSGTTVKCIRHYEDIGLLPTPQRLGKYRVYTQEAVELLLFIKCAQQLGFRLREMQEIFRRGDELSRADLVRQAIAAKKEELSCRIEELQRHYSGLEDFEQSLLGSTALCDLQRLPAVG
ncbi:MerR family transcriptional regulator [Pseudomonas nitroreducens]|uniref:MerR family transcriptional regulator n=1 Tax=Pseudomonas nitroreducens TaxID=46680 RepID=UPI002659B449|nr:MerR family transcriptional regulator [Pseudomonas nitroreducens]MCP1647902.1 DNA-binding transcriptional MerR regulator [Pseudomonas nitroreducens]MCP1686478.1 DNA-binding transcriptional MerR regulator [Pseudomonas nitroreducens]